MRHLSLTNRHHQYRYSPIYPHLQLGQQKYQHCLDKHQLLFLEDYRHDRVLDDIDLLSTGYECFAGDFWSSIEQVDTVREENLTLHRIPRAELPDAYPNQFVYDEQEFIAYVDHVDDDYVYLAVDSRDHLMNQRFWGLSPRNLEQAMAMRLLDSEDVDMTVLTGPAGSGKTLLALAYGLHAILEQRKYNKLIVARSTPCLLYTSPSPRDRG